MSMPPARFVSTVLSATAEAANGKVTVTNGGVLTITPTGDMNLQGAFLQDGEGTVSTAGDIVTTGDDITFQSAVTLTGTVVLDTGAGIGLIAFNDTLDSDLVAAQDLQMIAGLGNIDFDGIVGGTQRLGAIVIDSAVDVTADAAITAESFAQVAGTGTTTFSGPVNTNGLLGVSIGFGVGNTGQNLVLDNTITTTGNGPVFFDLDGTAVISAAGDINATGAVSIDAVGGITTAGDVTTDDDDISFSPPRC